MKTKQQAKEFLKHHERIDSDSMSNFVAMDESQLIEMLVDFATQSEQDKVDEFGEPLSEEIEKGAKDELMLVDWLRNRRIEHLDKPDIIEFAKMYAQSIAPSLNKMKVDENGKVLSEPESHRHQINFDEWEEMFDEKEVQQYHQADTLQEWIDKQNEQLDKAYTSHSKLYEQNEGLHDTIGELEQDLKTDVELRNTIQSELSQANDKIKNLEVIYQTDVSELTFETLRQQREIKQLKHDLEQSQTAKDKQRNKVQQRNSEIKKLKELNKEFEFSITTFVDNIDEWLDTGRAADKKESKRIYDLAKAVLKKARLSNE